MQRRASWIAIACLALAGCAKRVPAVLEASKGAVAPGAPRILLAPLNLDEPLARPLESAVPVIEAALLLDLQRRGARVGVLYTPDALTLWHETVRTVVPTHPSSADLQRVAVAFGKTLAQDHAFDVLLLPSLALREAQVEARSASWDGVRRPALGVHTGRVRGLSLRVLSLRPERWRLQERWGGLELVDAAVSRQLLGDPANVAEGVDLVLDPIWRSLQR